ncbi:MAG: hypothetical protein ACODAB_03780 [Gemmatimonadota bacterium]
MGYKRTLMDDATDELFAHMQRCKVPGATEEDVREWMNDTRQFLADRYPQLSEAQLAKLEMIGRRYAQPVIPHGKDATARNRDEWEGEVVEAKAGHPEAPDESDQVTDITTEVKTEATDEGEPNELQTA